MALTQTLTQMTTNVRRFTDTGGTNALVRHPNADLYDYINRALGSLHRILTEQLPDQRLLSSSTVTTEEDVSSYDLPADFDHLISIDILVSGRRTWLTGYEMHERPALTNPESQATGIPFTYRLRGSNIEYLPTPSGEYTSTLWYVPTPSQLVSGSEPYDTINRLDDYLIAYASRFVAVKDKNAGLKNICDEMLGELRRDVETVARNRDKNSPSRIVDETRANRWGRRR